MAEENAGSLPPAQKSSGCLKWFAVLAVGFMILIALGTPSPDEMAENEAKAVQDAVAAIVARRGDAVKVDAATAYAEFQKNEVAALRTYEGKLVELSGVVEMISAGTRGRPMLALRTAEPFGSTYAGLASGQRDYAAALRQGQAITLLCEGVTVSTGSPVFAGCVPA